MEQMVFQLSGVAHASLFLRESGAFLKEIPIFSSISYRQANIDRTTLCNHTHFYRLLSHPTSPCDVQILSLAK